MSVYLYPEMKSKAAYKRAIAEGEIIWAENTSSLGNEDVENGVCLFEGPHYPKPHMYYGTVTLKNGKVVKII